MYANQKSNQNTQQGNGSNGYRNFLDVKDCTSKNGTYVGVTTICSVKSPQVKSSSTGKKYATAQIALNGCLKKLQYALGPDVPSGTGGVVWVTLSMWDNGHEEVDRFMKRFEGYERRRMVITGSLSLSKGRLRDGSEAHFVNINIDGYQCIDGFKSADTSASTQSAAGATAPVSPETVVPNGDFAVDLDDADSDVPF